MSKKGFLMNTISWILIFSFLSIFYLSIAILNFALWNDYVMYNMQNLTEQLEDDGVIKLGVANYTQTVGDQFRETNFHWDDIWFMCYLIFVMATLVSAYKSKPQNYFGFLTFLFYGIMFVLFLLTIFASFTTWWNDQVLIKKSVHLQY